MKLIIVPDFIKIMKTPWKPLKMKKASLKRNSRK